MERPGARRMVEEVALQRHFEGSRLEEELWSSAYEALWPLVRGCCSRRKGAEGDEHGTGVRYENRWVRGA